MKSFLSEKALSKLNVRNWNYVFVLMHSLQSLRLIFRHLWVVPTKNKSQVFGSIEINMVRKTREKKKSSSKRRLRNNRLSRNFVSRNKVMDPKAILQTEGNNVKNLRCRLPRSDSRVSTPRAERSSNKPWTPNAANSQSNLHGWSPYQRVMSDYYQWFSDFQFFPYLQIFSKVMLSWAFSAGHI